MSLIKVRRNRKKNWIDTRKPKNTRKLVILLLLVLALIWYLGYRF